MTVTCDSCGASDVRWREGRFACTYCGATVVPRLLPGTLCGELGGACLQPAQSLCRHCARPLCDRHNDPKLYYWNSSLLVECVLPEWSAEEARAWAQVTGPFEKFPVPGVEQLAWVAYERQILREVGAIEQRIVAAVLPLVRSAGGELRDYICRFESLCQGCEAQIIGELTQSVTAFAREYRASAFAGRLEAIEADLKQALHYVEAFLGRAPSEVPPELKDEPQYTSLTADSDAAEWDRCGWEIRRRLALAERLIRALPR